eukprot:TRINITY_DN1198_c0_g1_i12.p1 TRINITY_DN1198_c0_g1~~TRINITY_DN1198_c0_g1_i12.p1  ORF type:complete len:527 (+),score=132.72 TRINITY_DN1198_c0_g1_i12:38-1618(+)
MRKFGVFLLILVVLQAISCYDISDENIQKYVQYVRGTLGLKGIMQHVDVRKSDVGGLGVFAKRGVRNDIFLRFPCESLFILGNKNLPKIPEFEGSDSEIHFVAALINIRFHSERHNALWNVIPEEFFGKDYSKMTEDQPVTVKSPSLEIIDRMQNSTNKLTLEMFEKILKRYEENEDLILESEMMKTFKENPELMKEQIVWAKGFLNSYAHTGEGFGDKYDSIRMLVPFLFTFNHDHKSDAPGYTDELSTSSECKNIFVQKIPAGTKAKSEVFSKYFYEGLFCNAANYLQYGFMEEPHTSADHSCFAFEIKVGGLTKEALERASNFASLYWVSQANRMSLETKDGETIQYNLNGSVTVNDEGALDVRVVMVTGSDYEFKTLLNFLALIILPEDKYLAQYETLNAAGELKASTDTFNIALDLIEDFLDEVEESYALNAEEDKKLYEDESRPYHSRMASIIRSNDANYVNVYREHLNNCRRDIHNTAHENLEVRNVSEDVVEKEEDEQLKMEVVGEEEKVKETTTEEL